MSGTLYLCATPIGNLDDMTFRAVKILRGVDLIAAEDTRHTRKLLTHFDIHTPLIRYDEFSKVQQGEKILQELLSGKNIACVSDAGLPAISDPGADLVKLAINSGVKICPIPGANAALSALICSGLSTEKFSFIGFLPNSKKNRREVLEKFSDREESLIFYEAPHRLKKTLSELKEFFGDRNIVLARELTKIHEEFLRGKISEVEKNLSEPKGEFVIVVEGNKSDGEKKPVEENFLDAYKNLIAAGIDKKSAIRQTANNFNLNRREVYKAVVEFEEKNF
ncbi:MAG: 16S rRNA (cytidine(1402)-2'-O)-methyltransferase [Selenomonadaceae bacterium]|nr:16S rRNA (cytidine(1402)-2'-O)-methyltransferase [Selenomonadaceae bacterium]